MAIGTQEFDPLDTEQRRRTRRVPKPQRPEDAPDPARTRIVQFQRLLTVSEIDRLRDDHGLSLAAYIPNFAFVERIDGTTVRRLRNEPLVRAVARYFPDYKVVENLAERSRRSSDGLLDMTASLFDGGSLEIVVDALHDFGVNEFAVVDDRELGGLARVRFAVVDESAVRRIADLDDVRIIEPTPQRRVDSASIAGLHQSGDVATRTIWNRGLHGEGQVIWMMDGGPVDVEHAFFADKGTSGPGIGHRKVIAQRNASGADDAELIRHATYVAGCVAGDHQDNSGGHASRGSAWAAKLVCTNYHESSFLAELYAGVELGATIYTNSWHDGSQGAGNPSPYTQDCVDADTFAFVNEDVVVFGSSGNSTDEQGPPGSAKNAISVAAARSGSGPTTFGNGSPGPTLDGRRKPDIMAVGCGTTSAIGSTSNGVESRSCATSWAAPHAAGAAALIRQYFVEGWYPSGERRSGDSVVPTGSLIKAMMINSARDVADIADYPSHLEGWGLIRLDRVLVFAGDLHRTKVWDVRHADGVRDGDVRHHPLAIAGGAGEIRISLAWADAPGTAGAADPVVNDLDLIVTSPSGTIYRGNRLTDGVSTPDPSGDGDSANNVEVVALTDPEPGVWDITIDPYTVAVTATPAGGQGYAVVASVSGAPGATSDHRGLRTRSVHHPAEPVRPDAETIGVGVVSAALQRQIAAVHRSLGPIGLQLIRRSPRLRRTIRKYVLPSLERRLLQDRSGRRDT